MVGAKRREIGLGSYPQISLSGARDRARDVKSAINSGIDPIEQKSAAKAALTMAQMRGVSFSTAVDTYLGSKLDEFRSEKHRLQWRSTLDNYAGPIIGSMLVSDVGVQDVLRVLAPIWKTKTETASRLRGRIEAVMAWATVAGYRTGDNPGRWRGNLDALLAKPGKIANSGNHPAVALADVAIWFAALRKRPGTSARALEFLALTAARSGEVRGAEWSEFDFENCVWTVPAVRMKAGREHKVALTVEAVAIVKSMSKVAGSEFVFAAPRGGMLSDMSLSAVMRRMQDNENAAGRIGWVDARSRRPAVPHGLRSTFRDYVSERTDYPGEIAEAALAHAVGDKVEAAYRRGNLLDKRREMMRDWAVFLSGATHAPSQTPLIKSL